MNHDKLPNSNDTGGTCPRCGVYANFGVDHVFPTVHVPGQASPPDAERRMTLGPAVRFAAHRDALAVERVLALTCQRCRQSTLVMERFQTIRGVAKWRVVDHWPYSSVAMPEHLPEKLHPLFREAAACLQAGAPRGAAIMTRTTIDAALQDCEAPGGPSTKKRISSMEGRLPQQLIEMAHELRLGGNDATHEFEYEWSLEDAQELLDFLRQLLHHLYVVPQQLRSVQKKTAKRRSGT